MLIHIFIWMLATLAWIVLVVLCRIMARSPRSEGDWAICWLIVQAYVPLVHRLRITGRENIPGRAGSPAAAPVGPLVVVCNHTAGVDPLLVQAACPFEIRWMMLREMMLPPFSRLWEWLGVIPVDLNGRDSTSLRTALRHLEAGGVIGIFAEGGLERPHEMIMPYLPGVGLLALKAKAPILPVAIRDTPRCERAYPSLLLPSRSILHFLPLREYKARSQGAAEIAAALEMETADALGWARSGEAAAAGS